MGKMIVFLLCVVPGLAFAALTDPAVFQKVDCKLMSDGVVLKEHSQYMMNITTGDDFAKFAQIQFGDDAVGVIQYQLLIEKDLASSVEGSLIVLQNLKVGEKESSQEFSAQKVNWLRTTNEGYVVLCELPEPIQ